MWGFLTFWLECGLVTLRLPNSHVLLYLSFLGVSAYFVLSFIFSSFFCISQLPFFRLLIHRKPGAARPQENGTEVKLITSERVVSNYLVYW